MLLIYKNSINTIFYRYHMKFFSSVTEYKVLVLTSISTRKYYLKAVFHFYELAKNFIK